MPAMISGRGSSSKGGGGSSATSSPDTLKSASTARIIDLLCEGPIVGLVDGLKSVYLNDTQLQADDDTFNFEGVTIETRLGLPDQEPLAGFPAVETETAVSTQVTTAAPVTRTISDADITAIRVTLQTPAMVAVDSNSGSTHPTSIAYRIEVRPSGGTWAVAVDGTKSGKTSSTYQWAHRFDLPGSGPWDVRVVRVTADSNSDYLQNDLYWASYTAILDYRLSYPDCTLIGATAPAEAFGGSVPGRKYLIDAQIIEVPSNYDPIARTYSGVWDGTFKQAWTNNPAWVFRALATHERYGLGRYADGLAADKWALYAIAQYCDQLVDDGFGGQEPRFTCNVYINQPGQAFEVLSTLAALFAGMLYWGPGGLTATCDMPANPVKVVTRANVVDGDIGYSGSALSARHTVALVTWKDPADLYNDAIEVVEDPEAIQKWGWREKIIAGFGITSRGMARRVGKWLLDTEATATEVATWKASWDHADVMPGEIVIVADSDFAGIEMGGRIKSLVTVGGHVLGIQLDRAITLEPAATYTAHVVLADSSVAERTVATAAGTTDTLVFSGAALEPAPVVGAIWAVGSSIVRPRQFRVVARKEDEPNIYTLTALLHDPAKYARVESGIVLEPSVYSVIPGGAPAKPSNLSVVGSVTTVGGGTKRTYALVSWTAADDPRVTYIEAEIKASTSGSWEALGTTSGVSLEVYDLTNGVYSFRVRSADAFERKSGWLTLEDVALDFGPDFAFEVGDNTITPAKLAIPLRDQMLAQEMLDRQELWQTVRDLANSVAGHAAAMLVQRRELRAEYGDALASVEEELTAVASDVGALAQQTVRLQAASGSGVAAGELAFVAISAPAGVSAAWRLELSATVGGTRFASGLELHLVPSGAGYVGRFVQTVDQWLVQTPGGLKTPMFYDGGSDTLYLAAKVKADRIEADVVSSITTDFGEMRAGKANFGNGKLVIDGTTNEPSILVYGP